MDTFGINNRTAGKGKGPSLEIPKFTPGIQIFVYLLTAALIAYGFYFFINAPRARYFLFMLTVPAIFFLFRSRYAFLVFLVTGIICTTFMSLGAPADILKAVLIMMGAVFVLIDLRYSFLFGIISLYIFIIPAYQGFTIAHAAFLLTTIAYLGINISKRTFPLFRKTGLNNYLLIFYLWALLSITWCQSINFALYDVLEYYILFGIFLLSVSLVTDKKQLITIAWTWVIMAFLFSLVKPFYQGPETGMDSGVASAAESLFSAKNTLSSLINMSLFLALALFFTDKNLIHRILLTLAVFFMVLVNIIFGSRGGLFSLGVGVVLFLIFVNQKNRKFKNGLFKVFILLVILGLIVIIPLVPLLFYHMSEIVPVELLPQSSWSISLQFRFQQWELANQMMEDYGNNFFGLGIAGFKSLYMEYIELEYQNLPKDTEIMLYAHPHSYWVYTYTDMGLIGMILLHLFFILYVWRMRHYLLNAEDKLLKVFASAIFMGVISYWIHALADFGYNEANRLWLFIGIGIAITYLDEKYSSKYSKLLRIEQKSNENN